MVQRGSVVTVLFVSILVVASSLSYEYFTKGSGSSTSFQIGPTQPCPAPNDASIARYTAQKVQFGAVTEYCLANPLRLANGIAVAADGTVWFGVEAVPGVGHLFHNGTVVEYSWGKSSGYNGTLGGYRVGIWGVAIWGGKVWGTDAEHGAIVGLDPDTGGLTVLNTSSTARSPYTLTESPDGTLWFTTLSNPAVLGRVFANLTVTTYQFSLASKFKGLWPLQVQFVNDSSGYLVALNPLNENDNRSGLYRFSLNTSSGSIDWSRVGGFSLFDPDSLTTSGNTVWVAQHGPSSVVGYRTDTRTWTVYPTSTVPYYSATLPYFVQTNGTNVWFNEHYGNKIALLNPVAGTLTEYSEANPPIMSGIQVQDDLTIASAPGGLWFTSISSNYIGFVDGRHAPSFSIAAVGPNSVSMARGIPKAIQFVVQGSWTGSLGVLVSDSENYTSVPGRISIVPSTGTVAPGSGPFTLNLTVKGAADLTPGRYTVAVTVTDGLVYQTAYVFLTVT